MHDQRVVVIGCGRIGLPMALALVEAGFDVVGVDTDDELRYAVNWERRMPFLEPGFEEILSTGRLLIHHDLSLAPPASTYIVCVGTPHEVLDGSNAPLHFLSVVVRQLGPRLTPGALVVFRSTLPPGGGAVLCKWLVDTSGLDRSEFAVAYCPERLTEGNARVELKTLPQMIGADDAASAALARDLFGSLGMPLLPTAPICEVELAKLVCNAARYAEFAVANALFAVIDGFGYDPQHVFSIANFGYPRPVAARPGLTAGPCLRKDWALLVTERLEGALLRSAWHTNEAMPQVLVDGIDRRIGPLEGKTVGVLGLAFKANSDDVRDSLAIELCKSLENEDLAELFVHDPLVPNVELPNVVRLEDPIELCMRCDVIFIATNHAQYVKCADVIVQTARGHGALIVDVWNALGTGSTYIR